MRLSIHHIAINCAPPHEPYEVAEFWGRLLGLRVDPEDEPGDDEVGLEVPEGDPTVLVIRVLDAKTTTNRAHLDLQPDVPRDEAVEHVRNLGAGVVDDRRSSNGRGWVVFADPAGNEFCVEASAAEVEVFKQEDAAKLDRDG